MLDTLAYAITAELRKLGHDVKTADAPKGRPKQFTKDADDLAVLGGASLTPEAVKACADRVRRRLREACEPYALDAGGKCKYYPDATFAAW